MLRTKIITAFILLQISGIIFADRLPFKLIDGVPCAQFVIRNGTELLRCHLFVDPGFSGGLLLHSDAASELNITGSETLSAAYSGGQLLGLTYAGAELDGIDDFSRKWAIQLNDIPVWGVIGAGAFDCQRLVVNLAGGYLDFDNDLELPAGPALNIRTEQGRFLADIEPGSDYIIPALLSFADFDTVFDQDCAALAGSETGNFANCLVAVLNLRQYTAVRVKENLGTELDIAQAIIANSFWQNFPVYFDLAASRLIIDIDNAKLISDLTEQEYYNSLAGNDTVAVINYLDNHPDSRLVGQGRQFVLDQAIAAGDAGLITQALTAITRTMPVADASILLADYAQAAIEQGQLSQAKEFVAFCRELLNTSAENPGLHCRVNTYSGQIALSENDLKNARRYLLSALFILPGNSSANYYMGKYYQLTGSRQRAWARYLRAALADEPLEIAAIALDEMGQDPEFIASFTLDDACDYLDGHIKKDDGSLTDQAKDLKVRGGGLILQAISKLEGQDQ